MATVFLYSVQSVSAFAPICNPVKCPWGEKVFSGYLGSNKESWKVIDCLFKQIDFILPWVCSVIDQRCRQHVVITKKWHTSRSFIQCTGKKKRHLDFTCLVSLDCSRIFTSLSILWVINGTFRLCAFFYSLSYLYTVSLKRFSTPSLVQSAIIANTLPKQNCESLAAVTHDRNC